MSVYPWYNCTIFNNLAPVLTEAPVKFRSTYHRQISCVARPSPQLLLQRMYRRICVIRYDEITPRYSRQCGDDMLAVTVVANVVKKSKIEYQIKLLVRKW